MVMRWLTAALLVLALLAGPCLSPCAGWAISQQARMACCAGTDDGSQASADACCLAGEHRRNGEASAASISTAVLPPVTALPVLFSAPPETLGHLDLASPQPDARSSGPHAHVLFSVFLI